MRSQSPFDPRTDQTRDERPAETPSDEPSAPSKSQRKRDMLALQSLGERLVGLAPERLARMSLSPELLDALALAARIHSREGRRRQLQYVGKLMRHADAEAIQTELDRQLQPSRAETALMHAAERWRETLLESPQRLNELAADPPPELHAALQAARAEADRGSRSRHYRELYRLIKAHLAQHHG